MKTPELNTFWYTRTKINSPDHSIIAANFCPAEFVTQDIFPWNTHSWSVIGAGLELIWQKLESFCALYRGWTLYFKDSSNIYPHQSFTKLYVQDS